MNGWWVGMDLAPWCDRDMEATADFGFALAIAQARADARGVRQRVTRNRGETFTFWPFIVMDVQRPRLVSVAS